MQLKTTIQNTSQIIGNGTAYTRVGAYFYNSERGPGNYNGYVGNVWSDLRIVLENGNSLKAKAYLWKATLADQSAGETIFEQAFTTPIDFETEYQISIELIGSEMIYKCNGEKITYQISSQVFEPFQPYQHLTCRINPEEGSSASIMALFDDVTFSNGSVDVNGDGDTNLIDAILALKVISGLQSVGVQRDADVNGDGCVGIEEAIVIFQKLAGLR